jgi:2-polyprenyl-3-methyl-5-hydroxy-6-metoxy-1,4-benzoquinol methylase
MIRARAAAEKSLSSVAGNNMDLKETYNKIASDWHQDHMADDWWIEGTNRFISLLKPGDLVLDVGCAGGLKSKYFIQNKLRVVGIDISEKMIEIAKKEAPTGIFFSLPLEDIRKLDYSFEAIFMQAVLLHVPKKEVFARLREVVAKLKPGGYLYVAVKESHVKGVEEEIKTENDYGYEYKRFFSYFTQSEIEKYITDLGLEIIFSDVSVSGRTNWIQAVGRK